MKKFMQIIISVIVVVALAAFVILNQRKFGQLPKGERLESIKRSSHYKNGHFENLSKTSVMTSDESGFRILMKFFTKKRIGLFPDESLPVVKTDIKNLNPEKAVLIWFGHSSYYMQIKGKSFLVDPVFSNYGSPFPFINKSFRGTNIYNASDFGEIDYLIITHDHWDHLDYRTVMNLKLNVFYLCIIQNLH